MQQMPTVWSIKLATQLATGHISHNNIWIVWSLWQDFTEDRASNNQFNIWSLLYNIVEWGRSFADFGRSAVDQACHSNWF